MTDALRPAVLAYVEGRSSQVADGTPTAAPHHLPDPRPPRPAAPANPARPALFLEAVRRQRPGVRSCADVIYDAVARDRPRTAHEGQPVAAIRRLPVVDEVLHGTGQYRPRQRRRQL